jgi:predicted CoA-substrate-specific enzyme activase
MLKIGIDLGSRFVKVAFKKDDDFVFKIFDTVSFYKKYVKKEGDHLVIKHDFLSEKVDKIVATGYGRNLLAFSNADIISEIKAHFKGAKFQTDETSFTLIDLGGQDSKVIKVVDGYIEDFIMNDKCAASTGRFLENAAMLLKIDLKELENCIENPVKLNSTCAIFSESEIIGKIAEGADFAEIAAGVNESIAKRIAPLIKKMKSDRYFISGGVANIFAVRYFLEQEIGFNLTPLKNCQFNGAIGCLIS